MLDSLGMVFFSGECGSDCDGASDRPAAGNARIPEWCVGRSY